MHGFPIFAKLINSFSSRDSWVVNKIVFVAGSFPIIHATCNDFSTIKSPQTWWFCWVSYHWKWSCAGGDSMYLVSPFQPSYRWRDSLTPGIHTSFYKCCLIHATFSVLKYFWSCCRFADALESMVSALVDQQWVQKCLSGLGHYFTGWALGDWTYLESWICISKLLEKRFALWRCLFSLCFMQTNWKKRNVCELCWLW